MQISITSTHIELTQALQIYIDKRCRALNRYIRPFEENGELLLRVEVARSTRHHKKGEEVYYVELTIRLSKKVIRIEQYDANMRQAIDEAQRRMVSVLTGYKNLLIKKKHTTENTL